MKSPIIEAEYPITFRQQEALELGENIKLRHWVVLIGMKRVGISNFLRFFINHKDVPRKYISGSTSYLFIPVDLNDLIELGISSFWTLTFKRIVDCLEGLDNKIKNSIEKLFSNAIRSQDPFMTIEGVRKSLVTMVEAGIMPTIFLIRFDRIKDFLTAEFFANLQGLKESTHNKLCFVFTSYRSLDVLSPNIFAKSSLSAFSRNVYIKPAKKEDIKIIFNMYVRHSGINVSSKIEKELFDAVDGYVQYLQLALVFLSEEKNHPFGNNNIFDGLVKDERIVLASEELWDSLQDREKDVLIKLVNSENLTNVEKEKAKYLWDMGFIKEENNKVKFFSPIFEYYIKHDEKKNSNNIVEFTKKENLLFSFLKANNGAICDREKIVQNVWPEVESLGVSDWAIDRLVARARNKLKHQNSHYEIKTVKTRGYKLVET